MRGSSAVTRRRRPSPKRTDYPSERDLGPDDRGAVVSNDGHVTTASSTPSKEPASTDSTGERRVVVGVDGSTGSDRALEFAAHEAAQWGALLHIVSAYSVPASAGWVIVPLEPFEESASAIVSQCLTRVHELEPGLVAKGEHYCGVAGSVLVQIAQGASLLVVGSRGHSEVADLLIGSVSEFCAHHAICPTVIVH
jgi:nucleotide-binding universal stress UspA family protein